MVRCDNCNRPEALGGVLMTVERHIEDGSGRITSMKWCLDCIRGTREERERREY